MIQLIILEPTGNEQRVTLDRDEYILGRDPTVSIPLRDRKVSRQHARIFRKGSAFFIEDLGSVNGVLASGIAIQGPKKLAPGLELDVGGFIITVVAQPAGGQLTFTLTGRTPPFADQEFLLPKGELEVGRIDGNAIVIPDTSVSRNHAVLAVTESMVTVRDGGSSNGTFVNGDRVSTRTLANNDIVAFGNVEFVLTVTGDDALRLPVLSSVLGGQNSGRLAVVLAGATVVVLTGVLISLLWQGAGGPELQISDKELEYERALGEALSHAELEFQRKEWDAAEQSFREVLRKDPIHVRAREGRASARQNAQHERLLKRAEKEFESKDYRRAMGLAGKIPSSAFYATEAAELLERARDRLADRATNRASSACQKQQWLACYDAAVEALRLQPESTVSLSRMNEAKVAMEKQEIEFEPYEPPALDSDLDVVKRYPDPELRRAIALLTEGEVEDALRIASRSKADASSEVVPALSALKRELDAAKQTHESGNLRSAVRHAKNALNLHGQMVPASVRSVVRGELQRGLVADLHSLGMAAFTNGMHTDAFHFWSQAARIDSDDPKIQDGLRRLEKQGDRVLDELGSSSRANCALIREVLATTRKSSSVNGRARSEAQKSNCAS